MTKQKPDILADVKFLSPEEGGSKKMAIATNEFACPLEFEGQYFDCRLLLNDIGKVELGSVVSNLPIKFLTEVLRDRLNAGSKFTLWEGGKFAEGAVTKLYWENNDHLERPNTYEDGKFIRK